MALNVLVVDDSAVMRSMIKRTLSISGIELGEVWEAGNGVEALRVLESNWLDLALIDINMPVMNGLELIDKMKSKSELADVPIIVISTEGCEKRIKSLQEQGVGFVHKPFTPEKIKAQIEALLGVMENAGTNSESAVLDSDLDF